MAILTPDEARRTGSLADLEGRTALAHIGPNWFAPVMGTGIVANASATLPVTVPGLPVLARGVWVLDAVVLLVVVAATALHWRHHPATARGHLDDPVMAHFYGAPAMALITVGAGALLVGRPLLGDPLAITVDTVLWTVGTLLGLWTTITVPARVVAHGKTGLDSANGSWLMPVVPPMVSAATGPLLVAHLAPGPGRVALQVVCLALFVIALVASLVVIALVVRRLLRHGLGPAAAVPTLWIVLGPLGQSVTAAHTMAGTAPGTEGLGLAFGVPVWGLALAWMVMAATLTARTAVRADHGLPFTLGWWSFTFPVGTVVTGSSALAAATGAPFLTGTAMLLYAALLGAWVIVATRTIRGVHSGRLLRPPR